MSYAPLQSLLFYYIPLFKYRHLKAFCCMANAVPLSFLPFGKLCLGSVLLPSPSSSSYPYKMLLPYFERLLTIKSPDLINLVKIFLTYVKNCLFLHLKSMAIQLQLPSSTINDWISHIGSGNDPLSNEHALRSKNLHLPLSCFTNRLEPKF